MFSVRILSCISTLGSLKSFVSMSNLNDSSTHASFFYSDEEKRSSSDVLLGRCIKKTASIVFCCVWDATRCSMHGLLLIH